MSDFFPPKAYSFHSVNKRIQTKSQSLKKQQQQKKPKPRKITRQSIILHELQECRLWLVCQNSSQTSLIRAACSLHTMSSKKQINMCFSNVAWIFPYKDNARIVIKSTNRWEGKVSHNMKAVAYLKPVQLALVRKSTKRDQQVKN